MSGIASEDGQRRRCRRWRLTARLALGLVLLAGAGFAGLSWYSVAAIRSHPWFGGFSTTSTNLIQVQLSDRHYAIPANYIDSGPSEVNGRKTILLETLWPSLEGRTKENYGQFRVGHHGQTIGIFLMTFDHLPISAVDGVRNRLAIEKESRAPLQAKDPIHVSNSLYRSAKA